MTAPRYIIHESVWYVRRDHVAEQLGVAITSAYADGLIHAGVPMEVVKRSKRGVYRRRAAAVREVVAV